ncbi:MAG: sporulation integral membrane protein YtvI [Oscillospiraceae bacterium]|jgi:sporulation integral membrane protein YtvI|nr:sporulation integral membrane protein YtvI [Oscillospiraceae bacterium]
MQLRTKTQAHLERLIDTAYFLLIIAAFYLFMKYAFWLVFPFLFSFFVATLLQKPMNFALQKIRLKKSFSAVVLVLAFYLIILLVIALIGVRIWSSAQGFMSFLTAQIKNLPKLIEGMQGRIHALVAWLPDSIEVRFNQWLDGLVGGVLAGENAKGDQVGTLSSLLSRVNLEWFKAPVSGLATAAGKIPSVAIAVVITVISSFFATGSYDAASKFIKRQLAPARQNALSAAKHILFSSLGKLLRSYLIIIGVTFVELVLGLLLLKLLNGFDGKYLLSIALATSFVDLLPVLGTGSVMIPWAIYNLIMGNMVMGVGLIVMWVVMLVVRQIIEPKLIASNLGLPPVATLAGMYIGLQLFGFIGMLIVPLLLILLKALNDEGVVKLWKRST